MRLKAIILAVAAVGGLVVQAANLPCGTYVISGAVKNSKNVLFAADDGAQVQAVNTNGTILSESALTDPFTEDAHACNFRLEVPLSTTATDKTAAVGDCVNLVLKVGDELNMAANSVKIEQANGVTNIFLQVVDVVAYTNANGEVVYVAKEYLDTIAPWLAYIGKDVYEPFADWDGDGSLNYEEYWNGTWPLDPLDRLQITDAKFTAAGNFAISFEYVGGHAYGLNATKDLANPSWLTRGMKANENQAGEQTEVAYPGTGEESGIGTIYVVPANTNEFFKVLGR